MTFPKQLFLTFCLVCGCAGEATEQFSTPIRVLIDRGSRGATLSTHGSTIYLKTKDGSSWLAAGKKLELSWSPAALTVRAASVEGPVLHVRGGPEPRDEIHLGDHSFRGLLRLIATKEGWLAVNLLPLEQYLAGTLGAEMNASWPLEALKAQAVASRTYALFMQGHPRHAEYDLVSGVGDQVYGGSLREGLRVDAAILATEGEYLAHEGKPVKVFFHARCGGATETESLVWGVKKSLHDSVPCPYCRNNPATWKLTVASSDLREKMPAAALDPALAATQVSPTGRIGEVRLFGRSLLADSFRSLLGYARLKSARFQWKTEGETIQFSGVGSGHGVGMCQWGAASLAKAGRSYQEILTHYYPRLRLHRIPLPRPSFKTAGLPTSG